MQTDWPYFCMIIYHSGQPEDCILIMGNGPVVTVTQCVKLLIQHVHCNNENYNTVTDLFSIWRFVAGFAS